MPSVRDYLARAQRTGRGIADSSFGALEAAAELPLVFGSATLAEVPAQFMNVLGAAGVVDPAIARGRRDQLRQDLTYAPRTAGGQAAMQDIGVALQAAPGILRVAAPVSAAPVSAVLDAAAVTATPDFSTLLRQDAYRSALEAAGADFSKLSPHIDPGPAPARDPAMLAQVGERMEKRFRNETRPSVLRQLYTQPGAFSAAEPKVLKVAGQRISASPITFGESATAALRNIGTAPPENLVLLDRTPEGYQHYVDTMRRAVTGSGDPNMAAVDIPSAEELQGADIVMDRSGKAGMVVDREGNIRALYNTGGRGAPKRFGELAPALGVGLGGTHLDAYDTVLPKMYSQSGLRPAARLPWNPDFAPEGWNADGRMMPFNNAQPDIMFMTHKMKPRAGSEVLGAGVDPYDFRAPYEYRSRRNKLVSQKRADALLVPPVIPGIVSEADRLYEAAKRQQLNAIEGPQELVNPAPWRTQGDRPLTDWEELNRILGLRQFQRPM
jgi:hypothetical protein